MEEAGPSAGTRLLARLVKVEPGEGSGLFWAAAYFFSILASYYVIRPLRDQMGIAGREDVLSWLFLGTLGGTLLANPLFGALVSRYPRRVFIPVVYRVLILNLVVFWGLLTFLPEPQKLAAARVFFVWISVFNLFAVSVFWGFMADLFRPEQGKRLFGFIALGGTLGAVTGSGLTASLVMRTGPVNLILLSAALLEASVYSVKRLVKVFGVDAPRTAATKAPGSEGEGEPPGRGVVEGMRLVARSPYLLGICLFLLFYTISSTFLYFEQARIVKAAFRGASERTAFFARLDLYVNLVEVVVQLFFTGRIIAAIGLGPSLAVLPVVTAAGFAWLAAAPVAAVLAVVQVVRRAAEFALVKPAREVLFTVVTREEKYSSKTFIDTFVYRGGDVIGAGADALLKSLGIGAAALALAFLPFAGAWSGLSIYLGRRQRARASATPGLESTP